jgi:hypothetical protein
LDDCLGFEKLTRREFERDGFIVTVKGERESVGGTAKYELHHAGIQFGMRASRIVHWFGNCGCRNLRTPKVDAKKKCPVCAAKGVENVMVKRSIRASAARHVERNIGSRFYRKVAAVDVLGDDGLPNLEDWFWERYVSLKVGRVLFAMIAEKFII